MRIKETIINKYNRKTGNFDRKVNVFEKYTVGKMETSEGGWTRIEVKGPKQNFLLCSTFSPLKVCRPGLPVKELPLFYVTSDANHFYGNPRLGFPSVAKIQGATHFALENDELIPYKSSGRGLVSELFV